MQENLPPNHLTIITSAITMANIREQECPGIYQYIMEEMYKANGLPVIKYQATVITGYQHHAKKKRGRETYEEEQVMEAEEGGVGGTLNKGQCSQSLLDLLALSAEMPAPTPSHTPASTPAGTPVQSPVRGSKEDKGGGGGWK